MHVEPPQESDPNRRPHTYTHLIASLQRRKGKKKKKKKKEKENPNPRIILPDRVDIDPKSYVDILVHPYPYLRPIHTPRHSRENPQRKAKTPFVHHLLTLPAAILFPPPTRKISTVPRPDSRHSWIANSSLCTHHPAIRHTSPPPLYKKKESQILRRTTPTTASRTPTMAVSRWPHTDSHRGSICNRGWSPRLLYTDISYPCTITGLASWHSWQSTALSQEIECCVMTMPKTAHSPLPAYLSCNKLSRFFTSIPRRQPSTQMSPLRRFHMFDRNLLVF